MNAIQLLLLSIGLYGLGALLALLISPEKFTSVQQLKFSLPRLVAGITGLLASVAGVAAAILVYYAEEIPAITLFKTEPFGRLLLKMDALSAFLVALICLVGFAVSLYSLRAAPEKTSTSFFTNLFLGCMLLVVTANNAFFFLVFWELMTLASYFLVTWQNEKPAAIRTGYIYLLVAHAGVALLMMAFFLLFRRSGSLDFNALRQVQISTPVRTLVFFLVFFGFGAKAGMVPLHFWTPATYAAAPDHASALMAGVMKKVAIYGILRFCIDLLGLPLWWWGLVVIIFGAISTVIGAFYALSERDLKRLLAYSSVENVGIILMGIGLGMIGMTTQEPVLTVVGLMAALYHMLNHAFFKSLLFLSAGAVINQTTSTDLNRMGGLGRRMPLTALTFLVAALSVSAIPPFNGFASEWFTYQAFFAAGESQLFLVRVFAPIFALLLALAGAFAVMVYIKAYGGAFTGPARTPEAATARDPSGMLLFSLGYLALGCILLGLGAPLIAPRIAGIAALVAHVGGMAIPGSSMLPLTAILLLGLLLVPVLLIALYGGSRVKLRKDVDPWTCGYGYAPVMSVNASSFDQPVKVNFRVLYWLRTLLDPPFRTLTGYAQRALETIRRNEPIVENLVTRPVARLISSTGQRIQSLQMGDIRVYCLYIIVTLAILLIVIFGRSGL